MQAHLGAATPGEHAALYRQAVGFIEVLQRRGRELASSAYTPYSLAFDTQKLAWELEFFVKHFIEAYRGIDVPVATRDAIRKNGRSSSKSWPPSRECSATAIITAAT